ncbi:hypothetical protein ACR03S_16100 (plasmid) [Limimaricola variabilis]
MNDIHDRYDTFDPATVDHSMRWRWSMRRDGDEHARLDLILGAGEEPDKALEERLKAALGAGWEPDCRRHEPTARLPYGAPSSQARAHILDELERRLEAAGVRHACCVQAFPTGWLHIAMVLVDRLCRWVAEGDECTLDDVKEKYGTLRVHVYGSARVHDLADWCEEQSAQRCMATGREGRARDTGWVLTLSDAAYALHQRDRQTVERMMYPPREKADA